MKLVILTITVHVDACQIRVIGTIIFVKDINKSKGPLYSTQFTRASEGKNLKPFIINNNLRTQGNHFISKGYKQKPY